MAKNVKYKLGERFCFSQDDSSHWYLIPVAKREIFDAMLFDICDTDDSRFKAEFEEYKILGFIGCYSFLAPECNF